MKTVTRRLFTKGLPPEGGERTFELFDNALSELVASEALGGTAYPVLPYMKEVRTIVDVGANVGAATVYFAARFPMARVLAFEPSPLAFPVLVRNTAKLGMVECFNVGLSYQHDKRVLYRGSTDSVTGSLERSILNLDYGDAVELCQANVQLDLLDVGSIDILKVDTEGHEVPILQALRLEQVGCVYVEYHSEGDRRSIDRILERTHLLGYGLTKELHRGVLCYVHQDRVAPEWGRLEITHAQKPADRLPVPDAGRAGPV